MDYPRVDPQSAVTPLTPEELDALDGLLASLDADGAMTLDGVDGYLTALLVGPSDLLATLPTAEWLPMVWGGDGPGGMDEAAPFASKRQRKNTVVQLLRHLRHLADQLDRTPEAWEPIFSIAEQGEREWADARDWCTGFLQAVDLQPEAWGQTFDEPSLAPLLALGGGLAGDEAPDAESAEDLDDPAVVDALSRAVPEAVLALARGTRQSPPGP
jgi:uncharacterized protein